MKILWISNITFPEVEAKLNGSSVLRGSGGWLVASAESLLQNRADISLYIASVSAEVKKLTRIEGESIVYYVLPAGERQEQYWTDIKAEITPDIVHVHGTEFSHGLAYIKACGSENVVLSMQGVMDEIAKQYCGGLTRKEILRNITLHDILRSEGILQNQKKAFEKARLQNEYLKSVKYVIGRTTFDKGHVLAANPGIKYFHCNESMREEFYTGKWEYEKCIPHTIYLSQATYPLKGLHIVLKALPIVLRKYPDTQVRVAGSDGRRDSKLRQSLAVNGYQKILFGLMDKYKLRDHVTFTGVLSAEEVKKELLQANLFICPSSNENSSNSICEAQLLGTPVVASCVGGTPSLIPSEEFGRMYPFDDVQQLAQLIIEVFDNSNVHNRAVAISPAQERHNADSNVIQLLNIYNELTRE